MHQQIIDTLIDDPILAMLGFDHRTIGEERTGRNPRLIVSWADEWYGSASDLLGTVTLLYIERDGTPSLSELRSRVVLCNFWASWWEEEHSASVSVAEQDRDAGVTLVGIDYQDGPDSAVAFLDARGRGGDDYRYVTDPGPRATRDSGIFGVPETFVIDPAATIVAKAVGPTTYPLPARAVLAGQRPQPRTAVPVQPSSGAPLGFGS
ncbi:TlpA family protein disulfide reductase [Pseudonocardia alni]|uniref:Cytochrome c biogenesis protein CcmG/thiol:disulfide interchange protein DsbE n=1 Tax=Pseudonocardia alni TaxID=33907 RepID=A0A852WA67_PSEA5|nr:redoxin family protein [Pseudonocardia antarctica]NYG05510.1 cytochrome c biogenesis protein CcmG/thiol:disulfide interchange protein DsbE [Pseudonocardia antarctica]